MAEAAHPALVCKNWRRLIPLELRSLFILIDFPYSFQPTTSVGLFCDSLPAPQIGNAFFGSPSIFLWPAALVAACKAWPAAKTGTPQGARTGLGNGSKPGAKANSNRSPVRAKDNSPGQAKRRPGFNVPK